MGRCTATRGERRIGRTIYKLGNSVELSSKEGQAKLALLSSNGRQVILNCGHNMNLEKPDDVAAAIRDVVTAVRNHGKAE